MKTLRKNQNNTLRQINKVVLKFTHCKIQHSIDIERYFGLSLYLSIRDKKFWKFPTIEN